MTFSPPPSPPPPFQASESAVRGGNESSGHGVPVPKRRNRSDDEEDDTFFYRYASAAAAPPSAASKSSSGGGKNTLAPSRSTVYVSNVDFNLTNSDLHTIFSTFGKLAKVTVLKDRATRQSKGVAFVLFVSRDDAVRAAREMDGKILNGRTLRASIAADNGRAAEFIKKKVYKDKSRCYECGEEGHLSYECPRNFLGPREPPPLPKKGRFGGGGGGNSGKHFEGEEENEEADAEAELEMENWALVMGGGGAAEERLHEVEKEKGGVRKEKREKKKGYFSNESDDED